MISKTDLLQFYSNGKMLRGWKTLARASGLTVSELSTQDAWDICQDSIICPICKTADRKIKLTNTGRTETCGQLSCANLHKATKTANTSMLRYGVKSPAQFQQTKDRQAQTFAEKYGSHPSKLAITQDKRVATNIKKYGCATPAMGPLLKSKSVNSYQAARKQNYINIVWPMRKVSIFETLAIKALSDWKSAMTPINWMHESCGHEWSAPIPNGDLPWCPKCGLSKEQFGVENFISKNTNSLILRNDRKTLAPLELDIHLPTLNVAIELNGWYWHRDGESTPMQVKTQKCKDVGIKLIHVMDWEWNEKRHIVESHLLHALGKTSTKIGARSTTYRALDSVEAGIFFDTHHISGNSRANYYVGLIHNGDIVAAMSVGKPRWTKNADLEIIRWATKTNTTVVGGFSKILKHIIEKFTPNKIVSFCDLRWGTGNVYSKCGFELEENTKPNYWWIKGKQRIKRYSTQKHMLEKLLGADFDAALSESDNMLRAGWSKVSDSGNGRWILTVE